VIQASKFGTFDVPNFETIALGRLYNRSHDYGCTFSMFATLAIGLDGCRAGWIAATWAGPGRRVAFDLHPTFALAAFADAGRVAVDIPIGLPQTGKRACDLAARAALPGPARSRVFLGLRRPLLGFLPDDYPGANAWGKADGAGLSKQAWFILPKVAEVDAALIPADQARVHEAHPEVVFARLAGGRAVPRKKTAEGRAARLALLENAGLRLPDGWDRLYPRKIAQPDDLIDAAACAVLARWAGRGEARPLAHPQGAQGPDARGLAMEIWG
jgi:predicted RNase H-like nuclease